eukprot:5309541-Pyramimonas_sp.AAC.2
MQPPQSRTRPPHNRSLDANGPLATGSARCKQERRVTAGELNTRKRVVGFVCSLLLVCSILLKVRRRLRPNALGHWITFASEAVGSPSRPRISSSRRPYN